MGAGSWSDADWARHSTASASKPMAAVFKSRGLVDSLDPKGVKVREARDSADHPESTPIIVALDVTGSMGHIAHKLAVEGLGTLFKEILDRKPVTDPQLMFMAVGDVECDSVPLQASQFESDNRIIGQLTDIYLEMGGGGNSHESYHLPWYFAGLKTSTDAFEKRGKKGYLFTIGDEETPIALTRNHIKKALGDDSERDYTLEDLLELARRTYHVFHIIVDEGDYARRRGEAVDRAWKALLGQHVIHLSDYTKLSEVIVSAIQVVEGEDKKTVAASWSGNTSLVVSKAVENLPVGVKTTPNAVVRL